MNVRNQQIILSGIKYLTQKNPTADAAGNYIPACRIQIRYTELHNKENIHPQMQCNHPAISNMVQSRASFLSQLNLFQSFGYNFGSSLSVQSLPVVAGAPKS